MSNLVGKYEVPPYFVGEPTVLQLRADGTFELTYPKSVAQKGIWQLDGNRITLTTQGLDNVRKPLIGYVSDDEGRFYLVLWREGDDPDDADVFLPPR